MKKLISPIIIAILLVTFTLTADNFVSAESIEDLQDQIDQFENEKSNITEEKSNLDDEKNETESKINENMQEQVDIANKINEIEQELKQTEEEISTKENDIKSTNEEINDLNDRIDTLIEEIAVLEEKIEQRDALLRDRLRTIQQSGGKLSYLEVIFGAKSFADFISRATAVNTIMDQDKMIMEAQAADQALLEENKDEVETNKETVVAKKADLEGQKQELVVLKDQLDEQKEEQGTLMAQLELEYEELEDFKLSIEDEQSILEAEANAQAQAIAAAEQKIGELEQLAREEERKRQEEEERQRREAEQARAAAEAEKAREAEQARAAKAQAENENKKNEQPKEEPVVTEPPPATGGSDGIFIHPANGRLSSGFGWRVHPIYNVPRFHAGVDFAVGTGTSLLAPADGVVSTATFKGGFGNVIMISHYINGTNYTTVSAHLSRIDVSPGQEVSQGQVIGATGNTGDSTGPHLHFEVHVGGYGNPVDPLPYLK